MWGWLLGWRSRARPPVDMGSVYHAYAMSISNAPFGIVARTYPRKVFEALRPCLAFLPLLRQSRRRLTRLLYVVKCWSSDPLGHLAINCNNPIRVACYHTLVFGLIRSTGDAVLLGCCGFAKGKRQWRDLYSGQALHALHNTEPELPILKCDVVSYHSF